MQEIQQLNVTFKVERPLLEKSISVLEVITAIQEFHFLIDKAYLTMKKFPRMSPKERQHYSILATDFKKGSFEADSGEHMLAYKRVVTVK